MVIGIIGAGEMGSLLASKFVKSSTFSTLKERAKKMGNNWSQMRNVILLKRETDEALMKTDYQTYLENLQQP